VTFLCLPTPPGTDGAADLSIVEAVVRQLADGLDHGAIIAMKSTVPVGTTARLVKRLDGRLRLVGNPEFLREGSAVRDFLHPDRVVVGSTDAEAAASVASVYQGLGARVLTTDPTSAELIKYGANGYLATRLTFVNALANIAESVGADILDVVEGMGLDPRIGPHFLRPGPGYGGSCFPKDTIALLATSRQAGYEFTLLQSVVDADRSQRHWIVGNVRRLVGDDLHGVRIGMWGVAFKAGTDDTRESPALKIGQMLAAEGAVITAYDPEAHAPEFEMAPDPIGAAKGAELLLVATDWPEFRTIDLARVAEVMHGSGVYDLRNLLDPTAVRAAGLTYMGLGRPNA
jgi:UDPglucose 6-dehydrogenase